MAKYLLIIPLLFVGAIAWAAPTYTLMRSILPELDSTYELGTSTRAWLRVTTDELCLAGDCKGAWPSGGGLFSGYWGYNGTTDVLSPATTTSGIRVTASSTIGSGSQIGGLTVSGGATTTLNAYFASNIGIASTSPGSLLTVGTRSSLATTTPTFYLAGGSVIHDSSAPNFISGMDTADANAVTSFISGKYLYVGTAATTTGTGCSATDASDCEVMIYDISNVASSTYVGGYDTDISVNSIQVVGKYAYLATSNGAGTEFRILDVSNPSAPMLMGGGFEGASIAFQRVNVIGKYAIISNNNDAGTCNLATAADCEVRILDISDPNNVRPVSGIELGQLANGQYVSGNYLYVGTGARTGTGCSASDMSGCEVLIFDISNVASSTFVGGIEVNDQVRSVYVSGKYLYVVNNDIAGTCDTNTATGCELRIYDISNPANPVFTNGLNLGFNTFEIQVAGDYAYLTTAANTGACTQSTQGGCEFRVYDIGDAENIVFHGGWDTGVQTNRFSLYGKYAFVPVNTTASNPACSPTTQFGCEVKVLDLAGIKTPSITAGAASFSSVNVLELIRANSGAFDTSLNVGASGIYSVGPVSIGVATATASTTLTTLGNVGFGTTTPQRLLTLVNAGNNGQLLFGDSAASADLRYGSIGFSRGNFSFNTMTDGMASTTRLTLLSGGNVGIGTTSPMSTLSVHGNSWITGIATSSVFVATSTTATSSAALLSVTSAFNLLGDYITSVATWFDTRIEALTNVVLQGVWDFSNATIKQHVYPAVTWPATTNTATTTTATTTIPLGPAIITETWNAARCTSSSTLSVGFRVTDGTNHMTFGLSTATPATTTISTNNVFTGGADIRYLEVGPITNGWISCRFDVTQN